MNKLYIPINFDVSSELENFTTKKHMKFHKDKYNFLVHFLYTQSILQKKDFINIHSSYLKGILGEHYYKTILNNLIEAGIVIENKSYRKDFYTKSYRLHKKFLEVAGRFIVIEKEYLSKKLIQRKKQLIQDLPELHKNLYFKFYQLKFDEEEVEKLIDSETNIRKKIANIFYYEFFKNEYFYYTKSNTRSYTSISGMKKSLRQTLRYNNQPLAEVDISNCQFYLLNKLLREKTLQMSGDIFSPQIASQSGDPLYFDIFFQISHTSGSFQVSNFSENSLSPNMFPQFSTNNSLFPNMCCKFSIPEDVKIWNQITSDGSFYDFWLEVLNQFYDKPLTRDKVKNKMLVALNEKVDLKYDTHENKLLHFLFPNVMSVVNEIKKDDNAQLSHKMLEIEADLMYNKVAARILKEHPEIPLYIVHDAAYTIPEYMPYLTGVLKEEFEKYIGVKPHVKSE